MLLRRLAELPQWGRLRPLSGGRPRALCLFVTPQAPEIEGLCGPAHSQIGSRRSDGLAT